MKFTIKKGLLLALLFVLVCSLTVTAASGGAAGATKPFCQAKQTGEKKITVEGWLQKADAGYAVQVFAPGKSAANLSSADDATNADAIVFQEQGKTDKNGYYKHDFEVNTGAGAYTVVFFSAETGLKNPATTFNVTLMSEFEVAVPVLNGYAAANDLAGFKAYADSNKTKLAFYNDVFTIEDMDAVYKILYEDVKKQPLDKTDIPEATRRFLRACLISEANRGDIANVFSFDEYFNTEIAKFKAHIDGDSALQTTITAAVGGCNSSNDFYTDIASALLLEKVQNHNGVNNLRKVMGDVKDFCKIDPTKYTDDKLIAVSGVRYESVKAFENALKSGSDKPQGGGSGGGGGGGGATTGRPQSENTSTVGVPITPDDHQSEEIGYDIYTDIDDVIWARNAIVTLSDMGILKGKEALKFCPNDNVLREEFVKMIVLAFAENAQEAAIGFDDVDKNQWYYQYIAKAKAVGLANGYSDSEFGIGHNITREDLCVMAYNAYKSVKTVEEAAEVSFKDKNEISDYALEAVSFLSEKGVVNGVDGEHFQPKANATRAQAAKIVYMLLNI